MTHDETPLEKLDKTIQSLMSDPNFSALVIDNKPHTPYDPKCWCEQ